MREQLKWYDDKADNSPWIDALAELRQRAARRGIAFSTSRRSPWRSTSTQRRRLAIAITFSTSLTASVREAAPASNEEAPAISTDGWGRQPRVFLPAGFFGGKSRKL